MNTASASGAFVGALSGRDRTIVTATATGGERNAPRFGGFFVEALAGADAAADLDKDGRVSILEAFEYAKRRVAEAYQKAGNLLAEHAMLDDNGDGKGSLEPDPLAGDGALARTMVLTAPAAAATAAPADPALAALYAEQRALEDRIAQAAGPEGQPCPTTSTSGSSSRCSSIWRARRARSGSARRRGAA